MKHYWNRARGPRYTAAMVRPTPLRSCFTALIALVLATTQFAVPVCGMEMEAEAHSDFAGGEAHHALGDSHAEHLPAAHESAGRTGHHGSDGNADPDPSGCADMSVCVAPALTAASPVGSFVREDSRRLIPCSVEKAGSISLLELRRPPKSF